MIWVEGSWHDIHSRISKNAVHFGELKGLLLKIEAWQCFFNLCINNVLAISINPTATIHVRQAKTQQLEVVQPSVASSNSTEMLRVQREIKWESWSWASGAVHLTDRSGRGNMLLSTKDSHDDECVSVKPVKYLVIVCEWRVCTIPIWLYSQCAIFIW